MNSLQVAKGIPIVSFFPFFPISLIYVKSYFCAIGHMAGPNNTEFNISPKIYFQFNIKAKNSVQMFSKMTHADPQSWDKYVNKQKNYRCYQSIDETDIISYLLCSSAKIYFKFNIKAK